MMQWQKQVFERINCGMKKHCYFLHTKAPFSSVLLALPHKAHLLNPLLARLKKKADFNLSHELQQYKLIQPKKEILTLHSDVVTSNSIYGIRFNQQTQFLVRNTASG